MTSLAAAGLERERKFLRTVCGRTDTETAASVTAASRPSLAAAAELWRVDESELRRASCEGRLHIVFCQERRFGAPARASRGIGSRGDGSVSSRARVRGCARVCSVVSPRVLL